MSGVKTVVGGDSCFMMNTRDFAASWHFCSNSIRGSRIGEEKGVTGKSGAPGLKRFLHGRVRAPSCKLGLGCKHMGIHPQNASSQAVVLAKAHTKF